MRTVLHTESSPGLGGQEVRTLTEAGWIAERGWRVLLAGQPGAAFTERARQLGIDVVEVPMRGAWDLRAVARLVRLVRDEDVGLVHTHSSVDGWVGGLAARIARVPVVRTRHVSIRIRRRLNPVYRWLADRVITSGEAIRSIVVASGVPAARVVAVPAGVDLAEMDRAGKAPDALRRSLGLARPVIGSVAMFRGSKGHAHLLDAFAMVRERWPTARLLLVGDGIRRPWVEGLARERGLGDAVVFTGFRSDVPDLLRIMDCFALLQAFAARVPAVASSVGGIPEVVTDKETGILVAPEDAAALARGIEAVLDDPAGAAERAAAARRLVEERFSHSASVGRLLEIYESLLRHGDA